MSLSPVLSVHDLRLSILTGEPVLDGVSLDLMAGRILGVIGESGAGKSMIGAAVSDTLPQGIVVSRGTIDFAGRPLTGMHPSARRSLLGREIGFIPQEPMTALNPSLTIGQQVGRHLARLGIVSRAAQRERAAALLDEVGIRTPKAVLDRYPHQLSGGMLQRVLIAMAFASNPGLVIADEPTTALDVSVQARVIELLGRMRDRHGTGVLFITHDLELAADVCEEVAVLYAGRIVETGPASAVIQHPGHPYSQCLALATPSLSGPLRPLMVLPGRMPGVAERGHLPGCSFADRCPLTEEACRSAPPPATELAPGHVALCRRAEATASLSVPEAPEPTAHGRIDGPPILRASGLCKTYQSRDGLGRVHQVAALRGLDFEIAEGEFVGLVGESGSGKSTLTKLIMGLEPVTAGRLEVAGVDRTATDRAGRRRLAEQVQLIFQDPQSALNPRRTVAALLTQALDIGPGRVSAEERAGLARQMMDRVLLPPDSAGRFPDQLSGGQKQRVNIARALAFRPQVLIADEIVSGLDVSVQAQILELLRGLRAETGFSLLLVSHDLAVVRHVCDRVLVMSEGQIVEQGPVEAVFTRPQHAYTRSLIAAARRGEAMAEGLA